jgi:putative sporulation protein YyaC
VEAMNLKRGLFERKPEPFKISHEAERATYQLSVQLLSMLPTMNKSRPIVFVCIGTDRSTGDSLGPLIGTLLEERRIEPFHVFGTLEDPIHAVNMEEKMAEIHEKYFNPYIIGIDACLGKMKSVGSIHLGEGPLKPGAGVNKELPNIGELHITGIVNVSGFMEFFVLQNTRLNLVMKMAKSITEAISMTSRSYRRNNSMHELQQKTELH